MLPPRIHEILTARLRAPGIDLRVAQLAATLGGEFDEEPLRQLAGRDVDAALSRLEDAALIERVAEVRLGRYRFRHDLMRDTAYETQVLPIRQKTHRSVAELLRRQRNGTRRSGRGCPTLGLGRRHRAVRARLHGGGTGGAVDGQPHRGPPSPRSRPGADVDYRPRATTAT